MSEHTPESLYRVRACIAKARAHARAARVAGNERAARVWEETAVFLRAQLERGQR